MSAAFWLTPLALILIAFAFVLPPLLRKAKALDADPAGYNLAIAKRRLYDLKQQRDAHALTSGQFEEQYAELQASLADDLAIDTSFKPAQKSGRWMAIVLVLAVPLVSVSLYGMLGSPALVLTEADNQARLAEINAKVADLAEHLRQQPDDAEGWFMLGRSYKVLNQYDKANAAFEQAYHLQGENVELLLHYADALARANNGQWAGKPAELIARALELAPDNAMALWLAGMSAVEAGRPDQALRHWRTLAAQMPENSEARKELNTLMAKLTRQIAPESDSGEAAQSALSVTVRLDPALAKTVKLSDTVFIYAQALQGPPMPLAIVKKQVGDLPVSVTLDDSLAMIPTLKLSNFDQVKLSARVSKSGQAQPQPGDLLGSLASVATNSTEALDIIIDRTVE
ncbi:MAG: c-type cytochrome biogenesis protein CcmI [Gammaproteobacteria bacterium HGW-Gammaproteobacteria-3]|nr:MAG: c-type cytochrome biogenesis protein CcmI [Gammaproteobacteria bacterium HGW-Gammaproteobacteria-3]